MAEPDPIPTARVATNGVRRAERLAAVDRPRFSLWQLAGEAGQWHVCRWRVGVSSPCLRCRYDLKSLPFDGNCPECGSPIATTTRLQIGPAKPRDEAEAGAVRRWFKAARTAADASGFPVPAAKFVRNACSFGMLSLRTLGTSRHLSADELAGSVADFARLSFGGPVPAVRALAGLRLLGGEALGNVVFALTDTGGLAASADDRRDQFDDLFTLASLFDGW